MKASIYFLLLLVISGITSCNQKNACRDYAFQLTNGNSVAYQSCCGEGETLVLIHAGGLDQKMWHHQVTYFSEDYHVITYDIRGHGQSRFVTNDPLEITDLKYILEKEHLSEVSLMGCSLGAIIALDFAITYPNMVKKLVLISPGLIGHQEQDSLFQLQMAKYLETLVAADTAAMVNQLKVLNALGTRDRLPSPVEEYVNVTLGEFVSSPGLLRIPQLSELRPVARLTELDLPTLVMYGADDHHYIVNNALILNQGIKNSQIVMIKDSGHLPGLESPYFFNQLLTEFLSQSQLP